MKNTQIEQLIERLGQLTFNNEVVANNPVVLSQETLPQVMEMAFNRDSFLIQMDAPNFKKFKEAIGEKKIGEYKMEVDLSSLESNDEAQARRVLNIKLATTKAINNTLFSIISIEMMENGQQRKYHFISKNIPQVEDLFNEIVKNMPVQYVEERLRHFYRVTTPPHSSSFWSRDWKESKYTAQYDSPKGIDAITVNTFAKYLRDHHNPTGNITLVDVGGGKGRVANKLIEEARTLGIELKYILIEPDRGQCDDAKNALHEHPNHLVFNGTLQEFIATTQMINTGPYIQLAEQLGRMGLNINTIVGGADLIVSSGGPLNVQVVPHVIAHQNAVDFYTMVNETGGVIATGLTTLLLSKKELQRVGFKVENCVAEKLDPKISESTAYHPAYVMQKGK